MKNTLAVSTTLLAWLAFQPMAVAAVITNSLGNTAPGFANGSFPTAVQVGAAQASQASPFDQGLGNEVLGPSASGSWTHTFGAITDPILSASLSIGIFEHDSSAAGDQIALFSVDGNVLTAQLNGLFNASGGGDAEYNVYTIDLLAASVPAADLADGSVPMTLNLQAPGLQICVLQFLCPPGETANVPFDAPNNGANYIFSTLTIETEDAPPPPPPTAMPTPTTFALFGIGLLGMGRYRARRG